MIDRLAQIVSERAGWILLAVALFTVFCATRIVDVRTGQPRLLIDPSMNSMISAESEGSIFYDRVRLVFGSDETLVVAIHDPAGVFTPERLTAVQRITERIEKIEGVHHVVSLANALNIQGVDGDLRIEPFIGTVPETQAEADAIREEALKNPIYFGNLVSRDTKTAAVLIYLDAIPDAEFLARNLDHEIRELAVAEADGAEIWLTGGQRIKAETSRLMLVDLMRIIPLSTLAMVLVVAFSFRSVRGVLVPLSTIGIALVWSMGIVAMLGAKLNMVTVVIPPLIMVVGFAYAVHVVSECDTEGRRADRREKGQRHAVAAALRDVTLPVILTGLTTAAGFMALMTSPLPAIREFGLFATIGVLCSTVAALTFAAGTLAVMRLPRAADDSTGRTLMDRWLDRLAEFDFRYRTGILVAGAVVAGVSAVAITRIDVSTDLVTNFGKDTEVRRDFEAINANLEGAAEMYVILEADYADAFIEPVNMQEVRDLQLWMNEQPEIGGTTSLVDYIMLIHRGFNDNEPSALSIPKSRRMTRQLLFFGANDEIDQYADSRYQMISIRVRFRALDSGAVGALIDRIEERLERLPERISGRVTGNTVLVTRTIDDIAYGQAVSLGTAFVIIYAILALLFTSFRVGFIALIPNALPVLVYFGTLGITGVTLNTTTGLVACLVLGIAVDDTIHFLARFNRSAKDKADEREGIFDALRTVGRPVTYTSFALAFGFLAMISASMRNQVEFGVLAAFTLMVAWLVDITFTPALAARIKIVTLWDVLTLDLGDAPHRSIPLFRGMSATQARIAALMAEIRSHPRGHQLFRAGDEGDELYVVVEGKLAASVKNEDGVVVPLSTAERGDVTGEVALFHGRRTADVVAETDVRLIRLTLDDLNRLARRYPRIAAKLMRNLSRRLADRLAAITSRVR